MKRQTEELKNSKSALVSYDQDTPSRLLLRFLSPVIIMELTQNLPAIRIRSPRPSAHCQTQGLISPDVLLREKRFNSAVGNFCKLPEPFKSSIQKPKYTGVPLVSLFQPKLFRNYSEHDRLSKKKKQIRGRVLNHLNNRLRPFEVAIDHKINENLETPRFGRLFNLKS